MACLIDAKKIRFRRRGNGGNLIATYHDPCHLGRHSGIYDAPRAVIRATGARFVELPRNRENAWCCGVGGGVKTGFPEMAGATGRSLVEEALSVGARTIVTACPACESGLADVVKGAGELRGVRIMDVVDLVADCVE